MFSELEPDDAAELDKKRALVAEAIRARNAGSLKRSTSDLRLIQLLLDSGAFARDARYELQCLGVCFGDVLASASPLRWVIVDDEFGRDPTLRWPDTTLNINAMTMISKRVEDGERVDVSELAALILKRAKELAAEDK